MATWVLVGAVAALGLAAWVDALRGGEEVARAPAPEASAVPGLLERTEKTVLALREVGVGGVLTYSDDDCRLHAVSPPPLEPARAPSLEMCRPATGRPTALVGRGHAGDSAESERPVLRAARPQPCWRSGLAIHAERT